MSPLQAKLLSEADVTYKASIEFEYLLNAVVFNYTTLRCKLSSIHTFTVLLEMEVCANYL